MAKVLCLSHDAIQLVGSSSSKFVGAFMRTPYLFYNVWHTSHINVYVGCTQWSCQTLKKWCVLRIDPPIFSKGDWCVESVGGLVLVSELQVIVEMRWLAFGCTLVSRPHVGANPARNRISQKCSQSKFYRNNSCTTMVWSSDKHVQSLKPPFNSPLQSNFFRIRSSQ